MAILRSGVASAASQAASSGSNAQFGDTTPWAQAVRNLSSTGSWNPPTEAPGSNVINEPNVYMPMIRRVPVDTMPEPTKPAWSLETDPLYASALAAGQAQFNYARNAALAEKQTQELGLSNQRKALDTSAAEARRRTAGNYAARGMAGGAAGALSLAEARANAEQVASRTAISDQITALNNNFLQNYGDVTAKNYDWTGTLTGQQYKTQAAQQALEAALSRLGNV